MFFQSDLDYIENLELDSVPWGRLLTAYGRAAELPDLLVGVAEGDVSFVEQVMEQIEHQSTLWQATPFAVLFLCRIYADNDDEELLSAITDGFIAVVEAASEQFNNFAMPYPPSLSEMLDDDYLMPDIEDLDDEEESDELYWEDGGPSSELFAGFIIHSFELIKNSMGRIKELANSGDADLADAAGALAELIEGTSYSYENEN